LLRLLLYSALALSANWAFCSSALLNEKSSNSVNQTGKPALPEGSRLVAVHGQRLHIRTIGSSNPGPLIVMLSGPTESWHSDSAWFAALQPLLARSMQTVVIDRSGQGFSEGDGAGGYEGFAAQLSELLPRLSRSPVIVVAFASANLALHHYFAANQHGGQIAAALLIDPDALHPDLLEFYSSQAVPFKNPALRQYVEEGGYDSRAQELLEGDRTHVYSVLPDDADEYFDQRYFEQILATRTTHRNIIARFTEIARYDKDVLLAATIDWPDSVPVWVFDSDFELAAIEAAQDHDEATTYQRWRDLSTAWMQRLPDVCWIHSDSREHLAPIAQPKKIADLIELLSASNSCLNNS